MIVENNTVEMEEVYKTQDLAKQVSSIVGVEIELEPDATNKSTKADVKKNQEEPSKSILVKTEDGHKKEIVLETKSISSKKTSNDTGNINQVINSDNEYYNPEESPGVDRSKQYDIDSMENADQINYNSHNNIFKDTDKGVVKEVESNYGLSLEFAIQLQMAGSPVVSRNGGWVPASINEIRQYCSPSESNIDKYKYQFLDLSMPSGVDESVLKSFLDNKGILKGQEKVFIEAGKKYNVNEIYLVAHALLETGNGKSKLAQGINVNGKKVYNMFGIGAIDSNPIGGGSKYAYNAGWDTPEKAIMGGAKFVSEQYINHAMYAQNTLYEMRWNPARPCSHQYATDIAWATKQAVRIEQIYDQFKDANKVFDIPSYR